MTHWEVMIFHGAADIDVTAAPVRFGTTQIVLGPNGSGDPSEPLVYAPVELFTIDDTLVIRTTKWVPRDDGSVGGEPTDHREMFRPRFEFEWDGGLRISGFEEDDGRRIVDVDWSTPGEVQVTWLIPAPTAAPVDGSSDHGGNDQ